MRRISVITLIVSFVILSLINIGGDVSAENEVAQSPTIGPGTQFWWSYEFSNPESDAQRSGTMNATVTETSWRGYECFKFQGLITGTFTTTSGSGTESGTWYEYYRKIDLALMDGGSDIDTQILTDKFSNISQVSYSPPLTWIEFPLSYSVPISIWDENVTRTETWQTIINDDEQTLESGSQTETSDRRWVCPERVKKTTEAGSFETFKILERIMEGEPENQSADYFYSEEVGWWVEKNVYVDHEGEPLRIKHYELTDWEENLPPAITSEPSILMDEDTSDTSVDLDDVFSDPDDDTLTFTIIDSGSLSADIDSGNIIEITPPLNAYGNWNLTVTASDGIHDPVELVIPVRVDPVDDPPELFNPGLDPVSADDTETFTFSIEATDIDSATPYSAEVNVGGDKHDLSVISGDNNTGLILAWSGQLDPGQYSHYFVVDGIRHPESGTLDGPLVESSELPSLEEGDVDASEGGIGTRFTFSVLWMDPNGEEPDEVNLILDEEEISLSEMEGDPETGISFSSSIYLEGGNHSFHFVASLNDMTFRYPQTGEIRGPTVHVPQISNCGYIHLSDGVRESDYRFFINYRYLAGLEPQEVSVLLNGMEYEISSSDGTPVSGMNFTREISIIEGDYGVEFRILADGELLTMSCSDLSVVVDDGEEDDTGMDNGSTTDNGGTMIIVVLILIVLVCGIAGFILYSRKKKDDEWEDTEYEEGQGDR